MSEHARSINTHLLFDVYMVEVWIISECNKVEPQLIYSLDVKLVLPIMNRCLVDVNIPISL
jgi:hypothetical protein